ncbi:MAG: DUF6320 domain-containing protein [Eubacteriales bacterium]|nr:DUF6320 domain-containing protein [Eubacteriales bacterium]
MPTFEVHVTYPPRTRHTFWRRNARALWRSLFLFAGYVCLLVNLLTGGIPWSLIVIGGLMVAWVALLYRPQVENTPIKKLCDTLIVVCLYLILLDSILGSSWSLFVVPIVFFGDLVFISAYFLLFLKRQKRNFLPLLELIVLGLLTTACVWAYFRSLNWPMIVTGSVSLALFITMIALFSKPLKLEFQKKFSRG